MKTVSTSIASAAVVLAASWTTASASFVGSFEAPTYVAGPLGAQEGWQYTTPGVTIDTAGPKSGSQHIRLSVTNTGDGPYAAAVHAVPYADSLYSASMWVRASSTNELCVVEAKRDSDWRSMWGFWMAGGNLNIIRNDMLIATDAVLPVGEYHHLEVMYNPVAKTRIFYANGTEVYRATGVFQSMISESLHVTLNNSPTGFMDVDDISFTAVPAPGIAGMMCIGTLMAARRKR
jgi:hypothetical protein